MAPAGQTTVVLAIRDGTPFPAPKVLGHRGGLESPHLQYGGREGAGAGSVRSDSGRPERSPLGGFNSALDALLASLQLAAGHGLDDDIALLLLRPELKPGNPPRSP